MPGTVPGTRDAENTVSVRMPLTHVPCGIRKEKDTREEAVKCRGPWVACTQCWCLGFRSLDCYELQPGVGRPSLWVCLPAVGSCEREPVKLPSGFSVLHGVTRGVICSEWAHGAV